MLEQKWEQPLREARERVKGLKFMDLVRSRQRIIRRISVRTIEIDVDSDLSYWVDVCV